MLVAHLPRESATVRALTGEQALWGDAEHLLAYIADSLAAANWQRGGGKGPRPRLCPRPGVRSEDEPKVYGKGGGMTLDEARAFFGAWHRGDFAKGGDN